MKIKINDTINLELVEHTHAQQIFDLVAANRNHLQQWLPWVDKMQDVSFIENFVKGSQQRNNEGNEFAFVITDESKVIGRIGVYKIDNQNKIGEIGYWIAEHIQGKGIVTQTCKKLLNFCFNELNLNRIEIKCGTENNRSQIIPQRLNFIKEGIIRNGELVHGQFIDLYLYSLLKNEYAS